MRIEMLSLQKMPKRKDALKRLEEADEYVKNLWFAGASFINKSELNKKFGRQQANIALARYFVTLKRGNNVSRLLTCITPKEIDDLPESRIETVLKSSKEASFNYTLPNEPTEFDKRSIVYILTENKKQAIDWCIDNKKIHLVNQVKVLTTRNFWTVFYNLKSNRYFAFWPFCLTNWPGPLRKMLLGGTDVDLSNSIGQFIQLALNGTLTDFPLVNEYITNPAITRKWISERVSISEDQAKKILHATVNGCKTSEASVKNRRSALLDIIDEESALKYLEVCKELITQLKQVRKQIAPNNKQFIAKYFEWEKETMQSHFTGTGLIMHDGIDGCSASTVNSISSSIKQFKISDSRDVWEIETDGY